MEYKTCENCKHFVMHYYKRGQHLVKMYEGHCTERPRYTPKYSNGSFGVCGLWEEDDTAEERKAKILKELLHMADNIRDIALILNDDKNSG